MKRLIEIFLLCLLAVSFCPSPSWGSTVDVEIIHSQDQYPVGGSYPILFRLRISKPWYVHGPRGESRELIPTVLSFDEFQGLRVEDISFPEPERKKFDYWPRPLEVFSGEILVRANLSVSDEALPGKQILKGNLAFQACSSKVCLPPENVPINIAIVIVAQGSLTKALNQDVILSRGKERDFKGQASGFKPGAGLWLTLLGIFFGGLALNLTPCIYPLIPITVSYFGGRSQKFDAHTLAHGVLYICGLSMTNSVLGVSAALSGGLLGSALQNPFVLIFVAAVLLTLASSFFGFWEFRVPAGLTQIASKTYGGYLGTLFMGLTLGIVAAPCIGPFILGLLTYVGQKGNPVLGFLYFFILSIGLGLPLFVLAMFSGAIDRLPMSGDWLIWVRRLMGWVLVGMAAYLVSPLFSQQLQELRLLAGVGVAAGLHLGWLDRTGSTLPRFSLVKKALGVVLICAGIVYMVSAAREREGIEWIAFDEIAIADAAKDGEPLILDFYADWCAPCVTMDKKVFKDPDVVKLSRNFVTMRLDLTRRQSFQEGILNRYGVKGVPTVIFLNRKGAEERVLRIESLVGKSEVLEKMKWLLKNSPLLQE